MQSFIVSASKPPSSVIKTDKKHHSQHQPQWQQQKPKEGCSIKELPPILKFIIKRYHRKLFLYINNYVHFYLMIIIIIFFSEYDDLFDFYPVVDTTESTERTKPPTPQIHPEKNRKIGITLFYIICGFALIFLIFFFCFSGEEIIS